jgi:hypothetical protein
VGATEETEATAGDVVIEYIKNGAVTREFAALMVWLAEATQTQLTEGRIRSYAQEFVGVEFSTLKRAFELSRSECRFFPSIPEIRHHLHPNTEDAALLAWSQFNQAVSSVGAYMSVEVEDTCAAAALVAVFGGWPQFCDIPDGPALTLKRQEFFAAYRNARRDSRSGAKPARLSGICESSGQYALTEHVWVGRISLSGNVETRRDVRSLPPTAETKLLD